MSTLEVPDLSAMQDPEPDAVPEPDENVPLVPAEVEQGPDGLPRFGSACRYCGVRAGADAARVGGTFRLPEFATPPTDATEVRRVRPQREMNAVDFERAEKARESGDMATYGRMRRGAVVQEVTVPAWRVCSACEALGNEPDAGKLTLTALTADRQAPLSRTPTTLYVIKRHGVTPYHFAGQPTDRGSRTPWAHDTEALTAAAALLAELEQAGGVPAPFGPGCGLCGRTHSPYGWREAKWTPPGDRGPLHGLPLCDGFRWQRGERTAHTPRPAAWQARVGCGVIVDAPHEAGPFIQRVYEAARRDGATPPHPSSVHFIDKDRFMAWAHPDFNYPDGPRPPWWHVADIPLPPPDPATVLADRVGELEAALERRLGVAA